LSNYILATYELGERKEEECKLGAEEGVTPLQM